MIFDIQHRTYYKYSEPVAQSQHLLHLSPCQLPRQFTRLHSLIIEPAPALRQDGIDAFGNPFTIFDVEVAHKEFIVSARSTIEVADPPYINFAKTTAWDNLDGAVEHHGNDIDIEIAQFRCPSSMTTADLDLAAYAALSFPPGRPVLEGTFDLTQRIYREFRFDPTATDVSTPIRRVFQQRRGVCQDFAHLALACLRALRIPARYMSGYIQTRPPEGQPKLQGADASHAWISVWSPETGWCDFDPTNGVAQTAEHIAFAIGRDYGDVAPISGVLLGGGTHSVSVGVDVEQLP